MRRLFFLLFGLLLLFVAGCGNSGKQNQTAQEPAGEIRLTEVTFQVGGMHCEMCEASITKGVGELAGVDSVKATLNDSTAFVRFDPGKTSETEIIAQIEKRGYKVKGRL